MNRTSDEILGRVIPLAAFVIGSLVVFNFYGVIQTKRACLRARERLESRISAIEAASTNSVRSTPSFADPRRGGTEDGGDDSAKNEGGGVPHSLFPSKTQGGLALLLLEVLQKLKTACADSVEKDKGGGINRLLAIAEGMAGLPKRLRANGLFVGFNGRALHGLGAKREFEKAHLKLPVGFRFFGLSFNSLFNSFFVHGVSPLFCLSVGDGADGENTPFCAN